MTLTRNDSLAAIPGGRAWLVERDGIVVGAVGTAGQGWDAARVSPLRGHPWRPVGTAPTRKAAVALLVGP